ncbi:hypothetical protein M1146_06020 [Patescibacteria group bacterium]|nr:hypothetical protein [Patescibacteria group bacterium]
MLVLVLHFANVSLDIKANLELWVVFLLVVSILLKKKRRVKGDNLKLTLPGNSVIDVNEQCDPPGVANCTADCKCEANYEDDPLSFGCTRMF